MNDQHNRPDVYLNGFGSFFPGVPVSNDEIEEYLGVVSPKLRKVRDAALALNGIENRYYALKKGGTPSFLNEEMAEQAIINALSDASVDIKQVDCIAAGTTLGDLLVPSFAQMIHGRLGKRGIGPVQCIPAAGVCLAGMTAFQAAAMQLQLGMKKCALVAASERPSVILRSQHYKEEYDNKSEIKSLSENYSYFSAEFLRYFLSDGAASVLIQNTPKLDGPCLKLDWCEINSYAHETPPCMYLGVNQNTNMTAENTWLSQSTFHEAETKGMMNLRQDANVLGQYIGSLGVRELSRIIKTGKLDLSKIKHFFPHISSYYFAEEMLSHIEQNDFDLGREKWFTNLRDKGNTGCASIFIIMEEAIKTGRIKPGEKVLIMVPESSRFAYCYAQFTCVNYYE